MRHVAHRRSPRRRPRDPKKLITDYMQAAAAVGSYNLGALVPAFWIAYSAQSCGPLDVAVPEPVADRLDSPVPVAAIGAERQVEQLSSLLLRWGRPKVSAVQHAVMGLRPRIRLEHLGCLKDESPQDLIGSTVGMLLQLSLNHAGGKQWVA